MLISYLSFIIILFIYLIIYTSEPFQNKDYTLLHKSKHFQQLGHTFYKDDSDSDDEYTNGKSLHSKLKYYTN